MSKTEILTLRNRILELEAEVARLHAEADEREAQVEAEREAANERKEAWARDRWDHGYGAALEDMLDAARALGFDHNALYSVSEFYRGLCGRHGVYTAGGYDFAGLHFKARYKVDGRESETIVGINGSKPWVSTVDPEEALRAAKERKRHKAYRARKAEARAVEAVRKAA